LMINGKEISHEDYQRFAKHADETGRILQALRKEAPGVDPRLVIRTADALEKLALAEALRRVPFAPLQRLPVTDGKLPVRLNSRFICRGFPARWVHSVNAIASAMTARAVRPAVQLLLS